MQGSQSGPAIVLKKIRKQRLEGGHPWVFATEIERVVGEPTPGQLVSVQTHAGKYMATGYWNPASQIAVRVVSFSPIEVMDQPFFIERIRRCLRHRERFLPGERAYRLVYGEADQLPGLIVDRFEDVLVVQLLTLGMEYAKDALVEALREVLEPKGIYERSDVSVRKLEGLEERRGLLLGEVPRFVTILENGLQYHVDVYEGQKTGFFFDQRENRAAIAPLMTGWGWRSEIQVREVFVNESGTQQLPVNRNGQVVTFPWWDGATVLECFSHTGSFTLNACKAGAKSVTCLDVSAHAIACAEENIRLNGFEERVEFVVADAFVYLREQVKAHEMSKTRSQAGQQKMDTSQPMGIKPRKWDVIILDPPAFAKTKHAVEGAFRGYKEINLQALKLINEGGYLVTASCSYHMKPDLFLDAIQAAAKDAGKQLRLIEYRAAGKDHPRILGVDEGHYLKFAIFEVTSLAG